MSNSKNYNIVESSSRGFQMDPAYYTEEACENVKDKSGKNTVCENWIRMHNFIMKGHWAGKDHYMDQTLCPHMNDTFNLDSNEDGPECSNEWVREFISNPSKDNMIKLVNESITHQRTKDTYWNKEAISEYHTKTHIDPYNDPGLWNDKCKENPYLCLAYLRDNLTGQLPPVTPDQFFSGATKGGRTGTTCRWFNKNGVNCDEGIGSHTSQRRLAGFMSGIGSLIGCSNIKYADPETFDYFGMSEKMESIDRILPEFESLSYLCMSTQISAFQCKILENFHSQDLVYKTLLFDHEKIINEKLNQPALVILASLLIVMLILIFLFSIKIFR